MRRLRWVLLVTCMAMLVAMLEAPAQAAQVRSEDPPQGVIIPLIDTSPIKVTEDVRSWELNTFEVSMPYVPPNQTPVQSQCTPVAEGSSLCIGTAPGVNPPPIEVVGLAEMLPLVKANKEATTALQPLVDEATELVRIAYDLPNDDRIERFARAEIRSMLVQRLVRIMDEYTHKQPLKPAEAAALAYMQRSLGEDDRILAQAALEEYLEFDSRPCTYRPPTKPRGLFGDAVEMDPKVTKWCEAHARPGLETFANFAPPRPSVAHFNAWGAYRSADALGMSALANPIVQENLSGVITAGVMLGAIGLGVAAGAVASVVVGASFALAHAFASAFGVPLAAGIIAGTASVKAGSLPIGVAIGSAASAAAGIVAVAVMGAVMVGISIWQFVENEAIPLTLARVADASKGIRDPLGLEPLRAKVAGPEPIPTKFDTETFAYRSPLMVSKLNTKIALLTSLGPNGTAVADPKGAWLNAATEPGRLQQRVNGGAWTDVDSVRLPSPDGPKTVAVNGRWLLVKTPADQKAQAKLSFTYLDERNDVAIASLASNRQGGFVVGRNKHDKLAGEHLPVLSFTNMDNLPVNVRVISFPESRLMGFRPAAAGAMLAGRVVMLRPNPVTETGESVPVEDARNAWNYSWKSLRLVPDANGGTWTTVHTASSYDPKFTPTEPGRYRSEVVATRKVSGSVSPKAFVEYEISAPPIKPVSMKLIDNGLYALALDLQFTEAVPNDTVKIEVSWPGNLGQPATTQTLNQNCVQTGPLECTTPRTNTLLKRTLTPKTDLRQPVTVTVSNSKGSTVAHSFRLDRSPDRPRVTQPTSQMNQGLEGQVRVEDQGVQLDFPIPASQAYRNYVIGVLNPTVPNSRGFQLLLPNGNTANSQRIADDLTAHVTSEPGKPSVLSVEGVARSRNLSTRTFPIIIQETYGGQALVMLTVHITPSTEDRFRGALLHDINPQDFSTPTPPNLVPTIVGGRGDWPRYDGRYCVSLLKRSNGDLRQKCGPKEWFFAADGTPQPFPYDELVPGGLEHGQYTAEAWLQSSAGKRVDPDPLGVTFFLDNDATYPLAQTRQVGVPEVHGPTQVGHGLVAVVGETFPEAAERSYQWLRSGTPIPGATGPGLLLTAADLGHPIAVQVTVGAPGFRSTTETSAATRGVDAGSIVGAPPLGLKGKIKPGKKVTAVPGVWEPGVSLSYHWTVGGKLVSTKPFLKVTRKMKRKPIVVIVTGTKPGYAPVQRRATVGNRR